MTHSTMTSYYAKRAAEYERIYLKPERQKDLNTLQTKIAESWAEMDLLEIACGTGYWTQFACRSAKSIVATDYNEEVLSLAREKYYGSCPVTFLKADAYVLKEVAGSFSAALVGFWWSHVPKADLDGFLRTLHSKLCKSARVIIFDNRYVEGSSTPINRTDAKGNTYQMRNLSDGSTHEVLKNFPTKNEFIEWIDPLSEIREFTELDYFWLAEYTPR
jgi:demethylmenaquinone methyltransferase/2-methoxy-6-polyprenyl-1,4-benzoquinol methylase